MGGELAEDREWRTYPERDAVFVGTLDMLVSRALNRGYGESRWSWPIDFGLFNNGTQWVFDEVQLMGPALPTTRQMQSFREQLGSALPTSSMWMSATVPDGELGTIDRPTVATSVELGEVDRTGRLSKRLEAKKRVRQLPVDHNKYDSSFAEAVAAVHRPACRTLAFVNTVERAHALAALLRRSTPDEVNVVLVHSRFRPGDRAAALKQALSEPGGVGGTIVVTTQVLEAGVDVSSTTLVTEVAPWSSLVQRFGRCNRAGLETDAEIWWVLPPKPAPYDEISVTASASALAGLENVEVDAGSVGALSVREPAVIHHVLRRRDLLELFDTTPDLSGNDVDVARFIRDGDDLDLSVAWWELEGAPSAERGLPGRDERCPVPVGEVRSFLAKRGEGAWRYDHVAQRWVKARPSDLRPGMVVVIDAAAGGYEPHVGWSAKSKGAVPMVEPTAAADDLSDQDLAVDADPVSFMGRWVGLSAHLAGVEATFVSLDSALSPSGLAPQQRDAARLAARLHDVGKVHPAFQKRLDSTEGGMERGPMLGVGPPWAKSAAGRGGRGDRRYFRHELASALALLGEGRVALEGCEEPDLAVYLVAAHHGRVRLGIRGFPDEVDPDGEGRRVALGVADGEVLPAVEIHAEPCVRRSRRPQ
jgi:CRISPR-associated endonuclease/helicase Cas3